jgi:hypothetical protein
MSRNGDEQSSGGQITEHIFTNAPTMLAICLTMVGLIKIYAALQRVSTYTDDSLILCLVAFLFATVLSYLSLRSKEGRRKVLLARWADGFFLSGLVATTIVAAFVVFALAG